MRSHGRSASVVILAACFLQGCVATYAPAPGERMANVQVVGFGRAQICKDGKMYWAPEAKEGRGVVSVPAGARVTVGAHLMSAGYQVTYYCRPFLSFVPREGAAYVMNAALEGEGRCLVELVRAEPLAPAGLAPELSVGRPSCSPTR